MTSSRKQRLESISPKHNAGKKLMDAEGEQFGLQRHSSTYPDLEKGFKVVDLAVGRDLFHQFCGGLGACGIFDGGLCAQRSQSTEDEHVKIRLNSRKKGNYCIIFCQRTFRAYVGRGLTISGMMVDDPRGIRGSNKGKVLGGRHGLQRAIFSNGSYKDQIAFASLVPCDQ